MVYHLRACKLNVLIGKKESIETCVNSKNALILSLTSFVDNMKDQSQLVTNSRKACTAAGFNDLTLIFFRRIFLVPGEWISKEWSHDPSWRLEQGFPTA
jgi:hypothetical protein